ncbi:MAG: hypothetical protein Q7S88_02890 [Candidatus Daviesbacteria bacterium]|nr:hypothetical protein [Candidatus Daviesbacteria bacterium]
MREFHNSNGIVPSPEDMVILEASRLAEGKTRGVGGKPNPISEAESRRAFPDIYDDLESRAPFYPEWMYALGNRWTTLKGRVSKIFNPRQ